MVTSFIALLSFAGIKAQTNAFNRMSCHFRLRGAFYVLGGQSFLAVSPPLSFSHSLSHSDANCCYFAHFLFCHCFNIPKSDRNWVMCASRSKRAAENGKK